jgi:Plasmid pRiA4b ORF-3-like protein
MGPGPTFRELVHPMARRIKPSVYVFKVALKGAKRIWRSIAVRSDQTLDDLHEAIYAAFDRYDEHLYSFYFPAPGTRDRYIRDAPEYTHPFNTEDDPFDRDLKNAAETVLAKLGLTAGQRFFYLFDFGDEWWHEVTVQRVDDPVEEGTYPRVLERRGESPPQYPELDEEEDEEEEP